MQWWVIFLFCFKELPCIATVGQADHLQQMKNGTSRLPLWRIGGKNTRWRHSQSLTNVASNKFLGNIDNYIVHEINKKEFQIN